MRSDRNISRNLQLVIVCLFAVVAARTGLAAEQIGTLRLTLPSDTCAVVGTEISIYFDNIVLTQTPGNYHFNVQCPIGRSEERRWVVLPKPGDVGTHRISVAVSDASGNRLGEASTKLHVVSSQAGADRRIRLLIVGDSLTHATLYPNELARLLNQPGNPEWTMLGTHRPKSAAEGVRHEGYGGWTWQRFVSRYEPNPDGTYRKRSSPFVFLDAKQKPGLDVARYFRESADGEQPDVVFFLLGINDCFSADPDDPDAIDQRIDSMFQQADILLTAFRQAAPKTDLAVCITTPPNARESGFEANYKGRYHRWGWKRIQHRLVERLLKRFGSSSDAAPSKGDMADRGGRIYLVPTELNLDPIDGYPTNNGVHPNAFGYRQIGTSLYCWLKWWMSQSGTAATN